MNCPKLPLLYLLYACFLTIITLNCCLSITSSSSCFETERLALVKFKHDLIDPSNRLSSWVGKDCCRWAGIVCSNFTGHVTKIKLANPYIDGATGFVYDHYQQLGGKINPSLLDLEHLRHLDLSYNNFNYNPIPSFIGSITSLRHLNLSNSIFAGKVPHELGNLTRIRHLDLGGSNYDLSSDNLQWVTGLVSLRYIDMSQVNLSQAIGWVHVTSMLPSLLELHLSYCQLSDISPSITNINFTSLSVLDLSYNWFNRAVPWWVFTLPRLVSLDIGGHSFLGSPLPSSLQNMTSLKLFRNSENYWPDSNVTTSMGIENWFYSLTHLEVIDLSSNYLQGVIKNEIGNLTSLISLNLANNQLGGGIPLSLGKLRNLRDLILFLNQFAKTDIGNLLKSFMFQKLEVLELDGCNNVIGHLPDELGDFQNLTVLGLSHNSISGQIPSSIGRLSNLKELRLAYNSISGPIPPSIGRLSNLDELIISDNQLNGTLPESLWQLKMLKWLDLSRNLLEGVVTDLHFSNMTRLYSLCGSENKLSWKSSDDWFAPFQLIELRLSNWQLGPRFPSWLQYQNRLNILEIANTGISDSIPSKFWRLKSFSDLNFSSNDFTGPLPTFDQIRNVGLLDLSNNSFSGSVHRFLCKHTKDEDSMGIDYINLGNNNLSGSIPDCLEGWQSLLVLKLNNNNLHGSIPNSIGYSNMLQSLNLRNNHLSGELPGSLEYCYDLKIVDLSWNQFIGKIPSWAGTNLSQIAYLNLHSNRFHGDIPNELCHLKSLQILDLAHNNFSGLVPPCFSNFSAMIETNQSSSYWNEHALSIGTNAIDNGILVTKGRESEYSLIMRFLTFMDLSSNNLSGMIPEELTRLVGLRFLNLSSNNFSGIIPVNIGKMRLLESLDLSRNHLSGEIPSSMSSLTSLNNLDLSHNNLKGQIPTGPQLQTLDQSGFAYNKLCGPPLSQCDTNRTVPEVVFGNGKEDEDGDEYRDLWFLGSIAIGFIVSFWAVIGPLIVSRSWRITYFGAFDSLWCNLCDIVFRCRRFFSFN